MQDWNVEMEEQTEQLPDYQTEDCQSTEFAEEKSLSDKTLTKTSDQELQSEDIPEAEPTTMQNKVVKLEHEAEETDEEEEMEEIGTQTSEFIRRKRFAKLRLSMFEHERF